MSAGKTKSTYTMRSSISDRISQLLDHQYGSFIKWLCLRETCHTKMAAHPHCSSGLSAQPLYHLLVAPQISTMDTDSQQTRGRDGAVSLLNLAIEALNFAKDISGIPPAQAVFGSVSILLTMIKVCPLHFGKLFGVHAVTRTLWPINLIMWSSGWPVLMYAEPLSGV